MKITSTRRLFLAGTGAVGGAAALAACGGQQTEEEQASQAAGENAGAAEEAAELPSTGWERMEYDQVPDGGSLTLAVSQLPNNWNYSHADGLLGDLSTILGPQGGGQQSTVIWVDETGEKTLNPDYIESAELTSEDPQTAVVKFNPAGVWSDGTPIVVEDLISEWNASKGENEEFLVGSTVGWDQIESITQTDDEYTAEIVFSSPYVDWQTLIHPSLPASATESPEAWNTAHETTPAPSKGPFVVTDVDQTGGVVTLGRNENWWGRAPKLETINIRVVEQTTQPQSFANGEIDVLDIASGDVLSQAETRSDAGIQRTNGLTWTHVTMNVEGGNGALADVKVREAIARGIDRNAIGRAVVEPLGAPVVLVDNYVYMPGQEGYEDSFGGLAFDAEAAGALLDEAGWTLEGEKRSKDGEELKLTVIVPAETKSNADRAAQIQTNLNAIGFTIELQEVPGDAYFDEYVNPKAFDLVTFSWAGSTYPESSSANLFYPIDSQQNYTNYAEESIGDINSQLQGAFDPAERTALANELSVAQASAFTVIPFYATPEVWGVKTGVVNYGASQFENPDWTQVGVSA